MERWGPTWGVGLLLAALLLGGYEIYLRSIGIKPAVSSREAAWVVTRERLRDTSTVVVGSSRMLALVDPEVWARAYGGPPAVQLATVGGASIRGLEHLAETPSFRGLVIADVLPFFGFDRRWLRTALVEEIAAYRRAEVSPAQRSEAYLRVYVPNLFSIRKAQARPRRLAEAIRDRHGIIKSASILEPSGYAPLQFRAVGTPANTPRIMSPASFDHFRPIVPSEAEFAVMVSRIFNAAATIEARGGTVVLVYTPGCGGRRVMEERHFPKAVFWAPLKARVGSRAFDLDDYPGYSSFPCYDGSHLDVQDAAIVTTWLAAQVHAALDGQAPSNNAPPK